MSLPWSWATAPWQSKILPRAHLVGRARVDPISRVVPRGSSKGSNPGLYGALHVLKPSSECVWRRWKA